MRDRVQRLGKNSKGYGGERIDIAAVLSDCLAAAQAHGWAIERGLAVELVEHVAPRSRDAPFGAEV